ncbi:hypothetical protein ACLB1E_08715 [Escherichia coli]
MPTVTDIIKELENWVAIRVRNLKPLSLPMASMMPATGMILKALSPTSPTLARLSISACIRTAWFTSLHRRTSLWKIRIPW